MVQKNVTVTVTYDENGRVTGASGGDATALRIARQKTFPGRKTWISDGDDSHQLASAPLYIGV
jgi:hypothetical protein